jgi:hypothetical protein
MPTGLLMNQGNPSLAFALGECRKRTSSWPSSTANILDRQQTTVAISLEHSDYFVKNLAEIRAEARVGFAMYEPNPWVTGMTTGAVAAQSNAKK